MLGSGEALDTVISGMPCSTSIPPRIQCNEQQNADMLLIDDNPMVIKLCALELRMHHVRVDALGPVEVLEALKKNHYRLGLCDYFMGFIAGPELVSEFREWEVRHRPSGPALIHTHTANMDECMAHQCEKARIKHSNLFSKPLNVQNVLEWLSKNE